jgi:flagellar basal-body rod modification protein FlgD
MESISSIGASSGTNVLSTGEAAFGDNPFLSLLITQLRNQTPLEPVDNQSFMQQMATYSSMEEQKELNDNMLKLLDYQGVLARLQSLSEGSALLGKEVAFGREGGSAGSGKVDSIFVDARGEVRLRIAGEEIGMNQVVGISEGSTAESGSEGSDDPVEDEVTK